MNFLRSLKDWLIKKRKRDDRGDEEEVSWVKLGGRGGGSFCLSGSNVLKVANGYTIFWRYQVFSGFTSTSTSKILLTVSPTRKDML